MTRMCPDCHRTEDQADFEFEFCILCVDCDHRQLMQSYLARIDVGDYWEMVGGDYWEMVGEPHVYLAEVLAR